MANELIEREIPATLPAVLGIVNSAVASGRELSELQGLVELALTIKRDNAAEAFAKAITEFQAECPIIVKSREAKAGSFGYTYASLDDIMREISPLLKKCGLAITFSTESVEHGIKTSCRVRHGTHVEDTTLVVPMPSDMRVNDAQRYGAALSYAKRYALCAALNIVVSDEDTDAEGLHDAISDEQAKELERLLMDTNSDFGKFCKCYAVERIADLPKAQYMQAITQIRRKQKA